MGGDDYVTKPFHNAVLLSRISANLRRSSMNDGDVYKKGELAIYFDKYKLYRAGNELKLSNNEWDMLKILVENKGRVVRRDVFFERLWDIHGNYVEYNTLTVNMSRLKAKLGTFVEERVSYIISGIFDRFEGKNSQSEFHAGIGLNLSKLIIEAHHGSIRASNSEKYKGAEFRILLPLVYISSYQYQQCDSSKYNKYSKRGLYYILFPSLYTLKAIVHIFCIHTPSPIHLII